MKVESIQPPNKYCQSMEINELAERFVWLSIGDRLPNTNQYQLTNWHQLVLIDRSDFRLSIFIDCVRWVSSPEPNFIISSAAAITLAQIKETVSRFYSRLNMGLDISSVDKVSVTVLCALISSGGSGATNGQTQPVRVIKIIIYPISRNQLVVLCKSYNLIGQPTHYLL